MAGVADPRHFSISVGEGIRPVVRSDIAPDVIAGVTLAALAIPEVMGYANIAGMPVITGLYTILLPVFVFAILGCSRHLVVGADSATAAVMAAGLAGLAAAGSTHYAELAGFTAIMAGVLLLVARLIRLGFIADFLSRTVLVGFLTGVGIQVACGQVAGMFGVAKGSGGTLRSLGGTLGNIFGGDASWATFAVSTTVILVMVGGKKLSRKVPWALVAVIGSIVVSWAADLSAHGVKTLGPLPGGLPDFGPPGAGWSDVPALMTTSLSIMVLILAQSAATSRAYAARYNESFDENVDLIGLAGANFAAGLSGTFVVNGSPTKTQMVDSAGGHSQLAQITTGVIVLVVLLFLTAPIKYMPSAVLAAVVFLIGIELVDIAGMDKIRRLRFDEFVVAAATGATVVLVGVEQGIVLAIILSIVDHLRRSYRPNNLVLVDSADGLRAEPVTYDARTVPGLVVYSFTASLYYANANNFLADVIKFVDHAGTNNGLKWFCLDAAAIADVDYTGAEVLKQAHSTLAEHHVRLVFAEMMDHVKGEFDTFGLTDEFGADAFYVTVADAVAAFNQPGS